MRVRALGLIRRWETLLVVLLIAFVVLGSSLSPYFLSASNFSDLTSNLMEKAIMALPLALIIIERGLLDSGSLRSLQVRRTHSSPATTTARRIGPASPR